MGEVVRYHDHDKAAKRWANMEKFHLFKKQGLIPTFDPAGYVSPDDTAPCEYSAPENDTA